MIVYLSGPISLGGTCTPAEEEEFVTAFRVQAAILRDRGLTVVDPTECEMQPSWEAYMRIGIRAVTYADLVAVLPRWEESRGARLEVFIARELGIPVMRVPLPDSVRP